MPAAVVARLPSSRNADVIYEVTLENGVYRCDCPGFWRWQHCRHATALEALGALPLEAPRPAPAVIPPL